MAVITLSGIFGAIGGAFLFVQSVVGESWARYFFILAGLSVSSGIAGLTGFDLIKTIFENVFSFVFHIQGFGITSLQLTIIIGVSPLIFYLIKTTTN